MIATDYYGPTEEGDPARIRAYASFDHDRLTSDAPIDQVGDGYFAVLIDQGQGTEPYQGITPLEGGSLAACAQTYFAKSEQIPTRFELSFGKSRQPGEPELWRGGGIMLQHMPKASPHVAKSETEQPVPAPATDDNWNRVNHLLDTVESLELVGPTVEPKELLVRLFHEESPRVFDPQAVAFGCTCSAERVKDSMSIYSAKDIAHMTTDQGFVTADCQFCGAHYELDPADLGFESKAAPDTDA